MEYHSVMERTNGLRDPAEVYFESLFLGSFKQLENGDENALWKNGFVLIESSFYLLANPQTHETIPQLFINGKLPPHLLERSGAGSWNTQELQSFQIADYLTCNACVLGIEKFRLWANGLVPDAEQLHLYKFKDPRNWWEKTLDRILENLHVVDWPNAAGR
jgi:hypothetical protein